MSLIDDDLDSSSEPPGPRWGRRLVLLIVFVAIVAAAYLGYRSYVAAPPQSAQAPAPAQPLPAPKVEPPPPTTKPQEQPREEASARPPRRRPPTPKPAAPVPPPAAPNQTQLTVSSDVDGAMVFIDRKYVGKTPLAPQTVTPGSHRLNVSAEGFDPYGETVDLQPGDQTINVQFKVVRLNERVAVKHKHTFGSCEGTLIATVDGIQYQTSHKDDAFRAPLAEMTTFKVDYLKNTLTIALRGGRTYNFTEQQGGADALLVFQQHVQKAIDQMKKESAGGR